MTTEELGAMPTIGGLYRRAVAETLPPRRARPSDLPDTQVVVRGLAIDRGHLRQYDKVCGFRLSDALPATYPHVLGFPLSLELMTREEFPLPLVGLVHIANTIEVRRPITADERFTVTVQAKDLREHARGRAVDLVTTAAVDGEVVWHERSTYLRKEFTGRSDRSSDGGSGRPTEDGSHAEGDGRGEQTRPEPPTPTALWRVDPEVSAQYARVSGDRNPIHTSTVGARLFGFPRRIAHGMWSMARCLAALEGRLPDALTVDVSFKAPILLPATVAFSAVPAADGGWNMALHDARSGRAHLAGTVSPASEVPAARTRQK